MQKSLHLTAFFWIAFLLFVHDAASSNPQLLRQPSAVVPPEMDEPLCYMRTPDDRILNLSSLCGRQPQVVIADQTTDGDILTGRVVNQTPKIVHSVQVNYTIVDQTGKVIARNLVPAEPATLKPGQGAAFKVHQQVGDSRLQATSVNWKE